METFSGTVVIDVRKRSFGSVARDIHVSSMDASSTVCTVAYLGSGLVLCERNIPMKIKAAFDLYLRAAHKLNLLKLVLKYRFSNVSLNYF